MLMQQTGINIWMVIRTFKNMKKAHRYVQSYVARGSILGREFDLAPQASDPGRPEQPTQRRESEH